MASMQREGYRNRATGLGLVACLAAALILTLAFGGVAVAQQPANQPGFLDAVSRWFQDSAANLNSSLKGTQENLNTLGDQATGAAKDIADSVSRLPNTRVVTARERCVLASNGAPDCRAAAEAVCKANGLPTGKSLDIQTSEDCPVQVWLSGRAPKPGECKTLTFVTKAICQ